MKKPEAEKLADLICEELRHPQDIQALYERIQRLTEHGEPLAEFLASKDRQHRRVFYLQSEARWFRGFGWTMAKALMLFGLLVGAGFFLARGRVTSDQASTLLFGASAFYVVIYLISIRRYAKNAKEIERIHSDYRTELRSILEELVREQHLQPAKYVLPETSEKLSRT